MKWDKININNFLSVNANDYDDLFAHFLTYTKSILYNHGIIISCYQKEEILKDALSEAFVLYIKDEKNITVPIAFKHWICKTAFLNFMNNYKSFKKVDFCDFRNSEKLPADIIFEPDKDFSWADILELLSGYCSEQEIDILQKHFYYGYTLKEIAEKMNLNYKTLTKRYERLLIRLKLILPCPK